MDIKRNYLKIEEIAEIVDKMVESDFSYNREVIKVSLIAKCCLDHEFGDMVGTDIYNLLASEGMIETLESDIVNYYIVDKMVREEMSVENSLRYFLGKLDLHIDEVMKKLPKNTEIKSILKDFSNILNKQVVDKNADI